MQNIQAPPEVIFSIPTDLPIPVDDGVCDHLENMPLPNIPLCSTDGQELNPSSLPSWSVIFCYPMTGRPGFAIPEGWIQVPGAAGCTPQACSYRDNYTKLKAAGVAVYGISTQTTEAQKEASHRLALPYPLLSDAKYLFSSALKLPMLEIGDLKLIKRLTIIVKDGVIKKYFYPVFPPDKNVDEVIAWLSENQAP